MAYAAVISLKHTIQRLINPTNNTQLIKSAYEELQLLEDLLKRLDGSSSSNINRTLINALDAQIREAACKLEDVIEIELSYVSYAKKSFKREIHSFLNTVKSLEKRYSRELDNPTKEEEEEEEDDDINVSSVENSFVGKKSTTVGLPDVFEQIMDDLLQDLKCGTETVSLVGMAGIGKTHLAREIYRHQLIAEGFHITAWVSVGPKDDIKKALVDIAAQIEGKPRNLYMEKRLLRLTALLQKRLLGRRYLIVLDDVWSTKVSSYLIRWLPTEGSHRFLVTTRLKHVAKFHKTSIHQIRFMNKEESWDLLWMNVFVDKCSFPPQLEKVGRKIAENCEGLPLLILAVAGILRGLEKTEEYWKKVADKKTTTFTDAYEQILKVLSLSYEYLPQRLRACFLYMGVFPQSSEIPVPKLINLLTVEDFLEPNESQTVEEFAMKCMKELVSSSVVIICKWSSSFRIKSLRLHCAYWHLCVKEARKNKFFHVMKSITDVSQDYIERQRRFSVQTSILFCIKEVHESMAATVLTARSLLCAGEYHEYPVPVCFNLMLLKVLDALAVRFYEFPTEVVKLLQLRYLALTHNGKLPPSLSNLQQLQCLILRRHHNIKLRRDATSLPVETWDMQELRHLRIMGRNLPDPSNSARLRNLITLYVDADSCSEDVFRGIPYLRKLGIKIELQPEGGEILSCFEHVMLLLLLRSLKCVVVNPRLRSGVVAPPHHLSNLPRGLKKLSLNGLGYSWKYISVIGSLPLLQVLKLRCSAFQGAEWETEAGTFRSLKFMLLEDIDLVRWTADDDDDECFPCLRSLILGHCYKLKEIPRRIGGISTLETIEVVDCSSSIVAYVLQMQQERRNSSMQVVITSSWSLPR